MIRVGAIRWDAWYASLGVAAEGQAPLAPNEWQYRAPWFATTGNNTISCIGTQANMDAEIGYAAASGLKFWAYDQYQEGNATNGMLNIAWQLHQSSSLKSKMNWCWIVGGYVASVDQYVEWFQQPNYECGCSPSQGVDGVLRMLRTPLVFSFGSNLTNTIVRELRVACALAGLGSPYIVVLDGPAKVSVMQSLGADAISGYIGPVPAEVAAAPYSALTASVEAGWSALAAQAPMMPHAQLGWDVETVIQTPLPFEVSPYGPGYILPGTVAERAQHIANAVAFAEQNPLACPSQRVLVYAWNECSEGGGVLCPTIGDPPPSWMLAALAGVLNGAY